MIELGRRQKLQVVKKVEFGVYLGEKADAKEQERVLLPAKQVPADTKVGDELEVFIYRDSADRLIATTRVPALELHQTAVVKVAEVGKIGAFLDWGLEKDLLLPYKEQTVKVKKLSGEGPVKRRIMDMGITKGVDVYVRKVAPLGDPVEVTVRGYELSLRKADAEMIEVE